MLAISTELRALAREGEEVPASPDEFAKYVLDLGAQAAFVAPGFSPARLRSVLAALPAAGCPIVALGGPNPRPDGFERHPEWLAALSLADPEGARRIVAERAARKTLELAAEHHIREVVVSLGEVAWPDDATPVEQELADTDLASPLVDGYVRRALEIRARFATAHFDAARRSLDALLPVAERLGVVLSVQQPARLASLPAFRELETLVRDFDGAPLGVWGDTAGAAALAALKLKPADAWIREFAGRLRGIFLGDARPGKAGGIERALRPGDGTIDFTSLRATFRECCGARSVVGVLACGEEADRGLTREAVSHLRRSEWLA